MRNLLQLTLGKVFKSEDARPRAQKFIGKTMAQATSMRNLPVHDNLEVRHGLHDSDATPL